MADIGKVWAGRLYGTNTGNLAASLSNVDGKVEGTVRFNDETYGPVVYQVVGKFDGAVVQLTGKATQKPQDVQVGDVRIEGRLTPEGQIRGEWSSTMGTGGNFVLHPHDIAEKSSSLPSGEPPQIHAAHRTLGAIRLHGREVSDLAALVATDFSTSQLVVTFRDGPNEKTYYWRDFEPLFAATGSISYMKLYVQQPDAEGVTRGVTVELDGAGENTVRANGAQESWAIGKAETLRAFLARRQANFVTNYRKYFGLNQILFLLMLIALPEMSVVARIAFVVFVILLSLAFAQIHASVFPNFRASPRERSAGAVGRTFSVVASWFAGIVATVFAAVVAYWLTQGAPSFWQH